jgi:hypothetical protein
MEKSESIKELAAALAAFQAEVANVKKDSTNPFFKSKYASLENIIETARPFLAKHGLAFSQLPSGENELSTTLMHKSGDWLSATAKINPKDTSPQAQGSAITYMRRYALSALLGLATEDDDDGNVGSQPKRAEKKTWQVPHRQEPYDAEEPIIVVGPDTDEPPAAPKFQRSPSEKRKRVKELLDKQSLVDLKTKEDYEDACSAVTGLKLEPANFDEIISKLNALQHEQAA